MKGCEALLLFLLTFSHLLVFVRPTSHFCDSVESTDAQDGVEETVNHCCFGWTGELCNKVIEENREDVNADEEIVLKDNALEIVVPVQRFTASQNANHTKKDNSSLQIVFPICMLVLLAALFIVMVYARKRYAALQRSGEQQLTGAPPVPSTSQGRLLDNHTRGSSQVELIERSEKPMQVDESACMSYRSRMNDLNQGFRSSVGEDDGKINVANVGFDRGSSEEVLLESNSDAASLISNDQN
ncbi:uncharacterized protein [Watersipora subatra]|uniref:uncharacterized protein n=1 Tax=Watersipora subatra TaxID=2589382 RepID=UPI00355ACE89